MRIEGVPFAAIDWDALPSTTEVGASGHVTQRVTEAGPLRLRRIEYSPGYLADHWCTRGHVLLVLTGALTIEHQGDPPAVLRAGMSAQMSDDTDPHRVRTETGATAFVVD